MYLAVLYYSAQLFQYAHQDLVIVDIPYCTAKLVLVRLRHSLTSVLTLYLYVAFANNFVIIHNTDGVSISILTTAIYARDTEPQVHHNTS
jgi:hypothetical protein